MAEKLVEDMKPGDCVIALRDLDPKGANVPAGSLGVVFEATNAYGDDAGPMVRWIIRGNAGGACNVYAGDVEEAL